MKSLLSFLGSGLGFGWSSLMPGTMGTISGLALILLSIFFGGWTGILIFFVVSLVLSVITLPSMTETYGEDPSPFVLDEWIGMAIPMALLLYESKALNPMWVLAAFLLFRIFDISKILGIDYLQQYHGWMGVVFDDVLAGIYSLLIIKILIFVGYTFF